MSQFIFIKLKNKFNKFLLLFIASLFLLFPTHLIAGCSPYIGQASLNEFFKNAANQSLNASDFAEVKILNNAIDISIYSSWEIKICEKDIGKNNSSDGCSTRIPLSSFTDLTKPWLVLQDGTIGKYINTKTGFDAVLLDGSGNLIDYLTVDSYSKAIDDVLAVSGSSCALSNLVFDYDAGSPGTSDKYVSRSPDGTGDWVKSTSAADPGTNNNTNDKPPSGSGTLPILSISDIIVNKGQDAIFTLTLSKTVAYDVSIQYQTQGGTAVPYINAATKYDYTAPTPGTILFPANTTTLSQTVNVTTNAINPANNGSVLFYLYLFNQISVTLKNNFPSATINPISSLHHIEFIHDAAALTCNPESITVKACANADCSILSPTTIDVVLLPTGWVGGDNLNIATGAVDYQLQHTVSGLVTLNATSLLTTNPVVCKNLSGAISSCDITFYDSGFIFNTPTQISCATSADITISAVQKSLTSNQCVPFFDAKTATLNFWSAYSNPNTGSNKVTLNYNVSDYLLDTAAPGIPIAMSFDANGEAKFTLTYADAGKLDLNATYIGSAATSDSGLTMAGNKTYVTKPAKFYLYSDDVNADCTSNDGTCSAFKPAGNLINSQFNLKVRAACADNSVTPNFSLDKIVITHTNTAPAIANGNIGVSSFNMLTTDNGEHIISTQSVSEVGAFTFTAALPASGYLGELSIGTPALNTSAYIGRFYPHHFDTSVTHACDTFTYSGQPFSVTTTAQNNSATATATQNYTGSFAFTTTLSNAAVNPIINFNSTNIIPATSFINGTANLSTVTYTFPIKETLPEIITLRAKDADTNLAIGITEGSTHILSGRTNVENTFGSELIDMPVSAQAEYYDTSGFVINKADSCTAVDISLNDIGIDTVALGTGIGQTCLWDDAGNSVAASNFTCLPDATKPQFYDPAVSALFNTTLKAPGLNATGDIVITLLSPTWLQFDWDGDGNHNNDPTGTASFGLYRGDDRVIYWREVF